MRRFATMLTIALTGALAAPLAIAAQGQKQRVIGGGKGPTVVGREPANPGTPVGVCAPQVTTVYAEAFGQAAAQNGAISQWSATVFQTHGQPYSSWANAHSKSLTCVPGNSGPGTFACTATGRGCTG